MLVTYIRSSLLSSWDWCPHKTLLQYSLGWPSKSGLAADKGSATHKALELLARGKLARQRGDSSFYEDELELEFVVDSLSSEIAANAAIDFYSRPGKSVEDWGETDKRDCRKWVNTVLTWGKGEFDPRNLDVVAPELYFDITLRDDWARYSYNVGEQRLEGQLAIRGTMDLLVRVRPGVLQYIDWKSSKHGPFNWSTRRQKTYEELKEDPQFLLYALALSVLFPGETVLFTVFYIAKGGPFTFVFDRADLRRARDVIRDYYERISQAGRPTLIAPSRKCDFCDFSKEKFPGSPKTKCEFIRDEVVQLGVDRVTDKYADLGRVLQYTAGGGRTHQK